MARDPVCGMTITERDAHAKRHVNGAEVYFCSVSCVQQFDAEPEHYYSSLGSAPALQRTAITRSVGQVQMPASTLWSRLLLRPVAFGLLAVLGLLSFYLGIITLAQGWEHALEQLADDRWFIGAIASGFGTQIGLYTYLRGLHNHPATGGVAASTGTSTAAMLACCAHHLVDILPIIGVAGAATFLNAYKIPMLWLGIVMNLIGIIYLLRKVRQQRDMTCHTTIAPRSIAS